jgi:hypothetical protein
MAGFEIIVRPVVFPNIRPTPTQSLIHEADPTKGFAVINGNGAKQFNMPYSWTASSSKSHPIESQRQVDTARIYQKDDDGKINKSNFVDVSATNKLWMTGGKVPSDSQGGTAFENQILFFQKLEEQDNIEILERDVIKKNPNAIDGP